MSKQGRARQGGSREVTSSILDAAQQEVRLGKDGRVICRGL
eukprot:CAMPEP_0194765898 /NCGR_PEP_ID=MMETSP0323_2-20130528/27358_1 /TAXON_ID=2866 ORGANISM="Crypthecodinium cohnii, Strain Seligo" /NCGR_SAMPLE_ID=MMETSP0323_2 /ASSEMBLY_ACC=CAM_ASM_000346 /LENGTH=40 /DNA_ID= /DNA_START= /DNA_END= /DNA_ORIENTATION=